MSGSSYAYSDPSRQRRQPTEEERKAIARSFVGAVPGRALYPMFAEWVKIFQEAGFDPCNPEINANTASAFFIEFIEIIQADLQVFFEYWITSDEEWLNAIKRGLGMFLADWLIEYLKQSRGEPSGNLEAHQNARPSLPDAAPALWQEDRLPKENPAEFIERHYSQWLSWGLSRSHILKLDKPLYMALANWLQRKGNELPFYLPTKKQEHRFLAAGIDATNPHQVYTKPLDSSQSLLDKAKELERRAAIIRRQIAREKKAKQDSGKEG